MRVFIGNVYLLTNSAVSSNSEHLLFGVGFSFKPLACLSLYFPGTMEEKKEMSIDSLSHLTEEKLDICMSNGRWRTC